ncbi:MAG: GTPase Era [Bacteroidales bacterium]|nr:GTPase Era [Bacteroidales bacterium]
MHRSGFVNILGNPNVGKSTLMNELVGEKVSIITSRAQTTRHRILGIVNGEDFQIVYSDTPGIIKPKYRLQAFMMRSVSTALTDADIILYVTDVVEKAEKNALYLDKIRKASIPVIVAVNKSDLVNREKTGVMTETWKQILPQAEVIPVSALYKTNLGYLFERILHFLPEGPPYYPKDALTDKSQRFFVSEIIREKILKNYEKEIPYSVSVDVESFREEDNIIRIRSVIYVLRDSQKGIIIGHRGQALKKTGTLARKDIEEFLGKKVYLELYVKVSKDWRDKDRMLQDFGYR